MDEPIVPIVKKILEFRKRGSVIDVGTGFGHHALFLAEQGFEVTALDVDESSIAELARKAEEKNLSIDAKIGDVRALAGLGRQWDVVICMYVLHFLQDDEIEKAVSDLKMITKPGGLNIITAHTIETVEDAHRKPHLFQPNELKELYADWNVLYCFQGLGQPFVSKRNPTESPIQKYGADLIAEKPL